MSPGGGGGGGASVVAVSVNTTGDPSSPAAAAATCCWPGLVPRVNSLVATPLPSVGEITGEMVPASTADQDTCTPATPLPAASSTLTPSGLGSVLPTRPI